MNGVLTDNGNWRVRVERNGDEVQRKGLTAAVLGTMMSLGLAAGAEAADKAADDLDTYTIDEIVVTATRTEKDTLKVPAAISVVTAEDIRTHNVKTLSDALAMLPGVYDARTHGMSEVANGITIRGFGESNILFLYDGMVMNDGYSGSMNWNAVSVEDVERIEVLRGAASSLYGGKAVGAVVNIIGKNPDKDSVRGYVSYGSRYTWKNGINLSKKVDEKWSVGFGYENKQTDGWMKKYSYATRGTATAPSGTVATGAIKTIRGSGSTIYLLGIPGTGASEDNTLNFKVKYQFTPDQSLTYRYTHDRYRYFSVNPQSYLVDAAGNPIFEGSVLLGTRYYDFDESDFTDYDGRRVTDRHALQYKDDRNNLIINAGLTHVKESGYSTGDDLAGRGPGYDTNYPSKTYKLDLQKTWDFGAHTLVTGFDFQRDSMDYIQSRLAHWHDHSSITAYRRKMGGNDLVAAVFLSDEYKINERFGIHLGLRLDHYKKYDGYVWTPSSYKRHEDASYTELSPKLVLEYFPDPKTTLYASFGHSFNPPRLYQLYSEPAYGYHGNPALTPEKSNTFEFGGKKQFDDRTYLGLSFYHAKTTDMIGVSAPDAAGNRHYINLNRTKKVGGEIELRHNFSHAWSAFVNYNYERATDGDGDRIYYIPQHTLHLGVKYDKKPWSAYLEGQYISSRNEPDEFSGHYLSDDAFFIANCGINYQFMKNATLSLTVENLFDLDYWQWYKARGRSVMVGVSFEM